MKNPFQSQAPNPPGGEFPTGQMPHFFTVAVMAVYNVPMVAVSGGLSNPPAPLLFSLSIYADNLPEDIDKAQAFLCEAGASQVQGQLPPGYTVAIAVANPVPPGAIIKAAAALAANSEGLYEAPVPFGLPYFNEAVSEGVFNTFRPGVNGKVKSPRYGLQCPFCGTTALRFSGDVDARTPDGYRTVLSMEAGEDKQTGRMIFDAPSAYGGPRFSHSPLTVDGPDSDPASPWKGHCGVSVTMTCELGHTFTLRMYEDDTDKEGPTGQSGPWVFLLFEYGERPNLWLNPNRLGPDRYPQR